MSRRIPNLDSSTAQHRRTRDYIGRTLEKGMIMLQYTTLDGRVLDLSALTDEQREYFDRCYAAYRNDLMWVVFTRMVDGPANPLLRETGGVITPKVWDHPLFQAVSDLEDRLGIRQEQIDPDPGDDVERDPLAGEEAAGEDAGASRTTGRG